jgi:hypothetical protein
MPSIEDVLNDIDLVGMDREGGQGEHEADLALASVMIRSSVAIWSLLASLNMALRS